ncbi:Flowering time control protein FCA, partial [Mucuna pruriens]
HSISISITIVARKKVSLLHRSKGTPKLDRHRGDRYNNDFHNNNNNNYRHSNRGNSHSRFSDSPMSYNNTRRSPGAFRSGAAPHHRAFDSPPRRSPGRAGGFRPMGAEAPGEFGFNGHHPPPLAGQKRGFPFSGRGCSPGDFSFSFFLPLFSVRDFVAIEYLVSNRRFSFSTNFNCYACYHLDGGNFAKLFVGSVPRTATEEDIRPLFEVHGNVIEVALIKDRKTGQHQDGILEDQMILLLQFPSQILFRCHVVVLQLEMHGFGITSARVFSQMVLTKYTRRINLICLISCCFIKYATSEEADQAIRALHNQHTLPGGVGPIQVRYADGERERLGAVEYKLFVGSLNKQSSVKEVEEIFSKYGRVEDVYLMRDEKKQSRGCGFVKYSHRDMALAAINALNGIYTMRGCEQPLIVRFADPKRPRQGDSRGLAFGGPGFGPRFDAPGTRLPSNVTDPMGDRMPPPNAWRPMHPPNMGPSSNAGLPGMGPPLLPRSGDMALPTNAGGPMTGLGGPIDGRFQVQSMPSMSQQNFNQPMQQIPPVNQQISPLQKPIQSSQELPPSHQLYPQAPVPYPQTSLRQHGQPQLSLSAGPLPSQQIHGQFPTSQPQTQQSALSAAIPQTPLDTGMQSNTALTTPNQQQVPPPVQQQPLQPLQQSPSPLAQMLSQQTQTLQASFHSSQQAFSQLQQQLQMMQPSSHALTMQQNAEATKKQSHWAGTVAQSVASTHAAAPAADVPSSTPATSALPAINQSMALAKCNWTEHLSPEGFKYYYNSITGESRWEKPEELTLYEQQKQQQRSSVQQSQTQSQPSILPAQQVAQIQQVQPQSHLQGQVLHQQQMQQPSLSSSAYGVTGPQNIQEVGYKQLHASVISAGDPGRYSQGIHSTPELMWKNKPA